MINIALLPDRTGGNLPVWPAPEPIVVLPVSDKHLQYAQEIASQLIESLEIRISIDRRSEKLGRKIRDAKTLKTPYILIVGEREIDHKQVTMRKHMHGEKGTVTLEEFIQCFKMELSEKL